VDLEQTALAMEIFLIGAVAWGTQAILGRGFYALGDTLIPTLIGSVLAVASIPVYWFMAEHHQHLGLAGASSIGVIAYTAVLWIVLYRRLEIPLGGLAWYSVRAAGAAAGAGALSLLVRSWLESPFPWLTFRGSVVQIAAVSVVFLVSFLILGSLTRVASWRDLRGVLVSAK
jgi:putative peptidoglycan lipid II flippase